VKPSLSIRFLTIPVGKGCSENNLPTHGSLTKAGKVRAQTPKIEGVYKKSPTPRKRNVSNYKTRIANVRETRYGGRRERDSF